mmetsp:Transcript_31265/g.88075  ORF Transcript_31265/g.88075 Transcript_31265/m.88075 type:complete len:468 (+) Transcript_31265:117-1520(+)
MSNAALTSSQSQGLEALLPWGVEQRVSAILIFIKAPLIVLVGLIGAAAELTVKVNTMESWARGGSFLPGGQTSCFTHRLETSLTANLGDFGIIETINQTLLRGGINTTHLFEHNITIDPLSGLAGAQDTCVILAKETAPNSRVFECSQEGGTKRGGPWGGIDHYVPFALIWVICKVLFIGIHPIDRAVKQMHPSDTPPEPIFKLLTEPYFQVCTFPAFVVMKVFHFIQYRLMPNALLGALASMQAHPFCPHWVLYRFDWLWGSLCYYMVIFDIIGVAAGYAFFKTVMGGKMVGTNVYRCYKTLWFLKSFVVCTWPILALFFTFGGITALIQVIRSFIRIVVSLDFRFSITVDVLRIFVVLVIILEVIELQFFIWGLLCPPLLGWLPCCACLKDIQDDSDGDGYSSTSDVSDYEPLSQEAKNAPPNGGSTRGNNLKDNIIGKVQKGMPKMPKIPMLQKMQDRFPGRKR